MVSAVEDEIAEIERGEFMIPPGHNSFNHTATPGNRPSSMGSVDTFNSTDYEKGDLLVSFPSQGASMAFSQIAGGNNVDIRSSFSSSGKSKQRNSISLNPMATRSALAGLLDMEDSDEKGEDEKPAKKDQAPSPPQNPKASGGPDHRPLVGGFAAAAYEAARVDYYKKQGTDCKGHRPKPRSHQSSQHNYPRYP